MLKYTLVVPEMKSCPSNTSALRDPKASAGVFTGKKLALAGPADFGVDLRSGDGSYAPESAECSGCPPLPPAAAWRPVADYVRRHPHPAALLCLMPGAGCRGLISYKSPPPG